MSGLTTTAGTVMLLLGGCTGSPVASTPSPPAPVLVTYEVEGTARVASVTYRTPSGTRQNDGADVPLTREGYDTPGMPIKGFASGDFVYISAQRNAEYGGGFEVTCGIRIDGRLVASNTSDGEAALVTCEARVP